MKNKFLLGLVLLVGLVGTSCKLATDDSDSDSLGLSPSGVRVLSANDSVYGCWFNSMYGEIYLIHTDELHTGGYFDYTTSSMYDETTGDYHRTVIDTNGNTNDYWFKKTYILEDIHIRSLGSYGYLYGKYVQAPDSNYNYTKDPTQAPDIGKWYCLKYVITNEGLEISGAYLQGGRTSTDSLEEAVTEFTAENGYFTNSSSVTIQRSIASNNTRKVFVKIE